MTVKDSALKAKQAALQLAGLDSQTKNDALRRIVQSLRQNTDAIVAANQQDMAQAQADQLAAPLLKRLKFDSSKIQEAIDGLESLLALPDPVGKTLSAMELDSGLELYKVACPIGVIGVIFESRPDALVQISSLCLKSGNAVLLKGGSEAARTNRILADLISQAGKDAGLPDGWLVLLETRQQIADMLALEDCIDLIIPRGSNAFVRWIMEHTHIPVMGHADGVCHLYVDAAAQIEMAVRLAIDAKCQYPAVCNAIETLLVHRQIAPAFLPAFKQAADAEKLQLRGCPLTRQIIDCLPATEEDWQAEYLDLILAVRVVESVQQAIEHINTYGSKHTDAIVTEDRQAALAFLRGVDSADVFWNASTRFADGYRFGLGAEVGISTGKLHARGPVGMEGLLTYKWILCGAGQRVADYVGPNAKRFSHRPLNKQWNT